MSDTDILVAWEDMKVTVAELELDLQKNARGVASAGVRVRKGLRTLAKKATALVRATVALDKAAKAAKLAKTATE